MSKTQGTEDVHQNLNRELIIESAAIYEDEYPDTKKEFEEISEKFNKGVWQWSDLERIVYWKSQRASSYFKDNDKKVVNETIHLVIETDGVTEKIELLRSLKGIQVPMASAFLTFMDPTEFTVIDVRAWRTLNKIGYLTSELSPSPSVEEYLLYLGSCRTLAIEYEVNLRDLDRALWILDTGR